jgi:two-component system sensor histidine kinase GlrK
VEYINRGQGYSKNKYRSEKDNYINRIIETLSIISSLSQQNYFNKIKELDTVEVNAIKLAVGVTSAALIFLVVISVLITLSISRPLSIIEKKTEEIARGEFGNELDLSSPPEVAELARAVNLMSSKLKQLDTMKLDFFASMSHELRTPLTSIKEGANLLKESLSKKEIQDKDKKLLSIIVEESSRLIRLVNKLMNFSKIEAGMAHYDFNRIDIAFLINTAVREIEPMAETNNIKIEVNIDKGLPYIKADHEKILQVLRNFIANALKFTQRNGSMTVSAETVDNGVKVSVSDTGIGIPEENLKRIFEKYQQGISTDSGMIKGVGLGLSISKHIIKAHRGVIWAESKPGEGSIFSFVLPPDIS